MKKGTSIIIHDCENAVHDAFKEHSDNPQALSDKIGTLYGAFGQEAVVSEMTTCMRIAYLGNRFRS